jgi:hypothetical protein
LFGRKTTTFSVIVCFSTSYLVLMYMFWWDYPFSVTS